MHGSRSHISVELIFAVKKVAVVVHTELSLVWDYALQELTHPTFRVGVGWLPGAQVNVECFCPELHIG